MRKAVLFLLFIVLFQTTKAQTDIKFDAGGGIFLNNILLGADHRINDEISFGYTIGYQNWDVNYSGGAVIAPNIRFYFDPLKPISGFYCQLYGKALPGDATGAIGLGMGHKWVSRSGFLLDITGGVGRDFAYGEIDYVASMAIGWRLKNGKNS